MSTNNKVPEKQLLSKKNQYEFSLDKGRSIKISSKFDNGNIAMVKQQNELSYRLQAVADYQIQNSKKSWFYFKVECSKNIRIRFIIQNVNIFESMYQDKNWARPVMKQAGNHDWISVKDSFLSIREQIQLVIEHTFTQNSTQVYFALSVPLSFQQSQKYLQQLNFRAIDTISYTDQVIGMSLKGRPVHLITIQDKISMNSKQKFAQSIVKKETDNNNYKKPVVLITARVHPGQVSSFYCLMGIIQFLLKPYNLQAHLLRKLFTFMIIPTVNPDGVYQGNYRMDVNGVNLNRVYGQPQQDKHPTVFSIKNIVVNILKQRKIQYHFDLHAHSCAKPAFIYGNALDDIVSQTQTQLYCKTLQKYTSNFKYSLCQFGQRHMKSKDKGQPLTKEGCARVVIGKLGNIINSYTVQTSIFPYPKDPQFQPITVANRSFQIGQYAYETIQKKYQNNSVVKENIQLGYCLMTNILQHIDKNPYCILDSQLKNQYRKQIAFSLLQNQERFKMLDIRAYQKAKFIIKFCKQQFYDVHAKQWHHLANDLFFSNISWPNGFKWFSYMPQLRNSSMKKIIKLKTQGDKSLNNTQQFDMLAVKKSLRKRAQMQRQKSQKQLSPLSKQIINFEYLPRIEKPLIELKQIFDKQKIAISSKQAQNCQTNKEKVGNGHLSISANGKSQKAIKSSQRLKTINYNQLQQNAKQRQKDIQLNALIHMKSIELKSVKNNVIMEFIEHEINRLNEKKKKELPSFNRLVNYKVSMRQKSIRMRNSSSKNHAVKSAKKMMQYGNIANYERQQHKQSLTKVTNLLFPKPELIQGTQENQKLRQRFLTINDGQQLQQILERKKKKSINTLKGKKQKANELKKKGSKQSINTESEKRLSKEDLSAKKINVRLPNISQSKLLIDVRKDLKKDRQLTFTDPGAKNTPQKSSLLY